MLAVACIRSIRLSARDATHGGLFAVDRQWFEALGLYDEGMETWGSENLELSWRAWIRWRRG